MSEGFGLVQWDVAKGVGVGMRTGPWHQAANRFLTTKEGEELACIYSKLSTGLGRGSYSCVYI